MNEEAFIFDTYALIEILKKNPRYEPYIRKRMIINDFIFAEFCYKLIKDTVAHVPEYLYECASCINHAASDTIKEAMAFRIHNKKKNLSMTDCISYIMARRLGIKFLTGDKEFEYLDNVEFVK